MIDELPDGPDPAKDSPQVFSQKAAASVLAQKRMIPQLRTVLAAISAFAAGGAFAIPFTVDTTSTAAGDPGPGKLRLNNLNQNAATALYLDLAAYGGADATSKIDQFGASSSSSKGTLRLVQLSDLSREMVFNVTAVATPAGYRTLTLVPVSSSAVAPFGNGATVLLHFDRTGDKGEPGISAYMKVSDRKANGVEGGAASTGWNTRTLNTIDANTISGASLASNAVTLPAGTYDASLRAPMSQYAHRVALFNVTDGTYQILGSSVQPGSSGAACLDSVASGRFSITSAKVFQLRHYVAATSGAGTQMGSGTNSGQLEVYGELEFFKVA